MTKRATERVGATDQRRSGTSERRQVAGVAPRGKSKR